MNDLAIMSLIEQRDFLNERVNNLEEENQQLIETNADIFIKIQKRDELLEEIPYIFPLGEYHLVEKYEEWLKQYEELKR